MSCVSISIDSSGYISVIEGVGIEGVMGVLCLMIPSPARGIVVLLYKIPRVCLVRCHDRLIDRSSDRYANACVSAVVVVIIMVRCLNWWFHACRKQRKSTKVGPDAHVAQNSW